MLEPGREMLPSCIRYLPGEQGNCTRQEYYVTVLNSFYVSDYLVYTDTVERNPIPAVCQRYRKRYKAQGTRYKLDGTRLMTDRARWMLLSLPEMAGYVTSILGHGSLRPGDCGAFGDGGGPPR